MNHADEIGVIFLTVIDTQEFFACACGMQPLHDISHSACHPHVKKIISNRLVWKQTPAQQLLMLTPMGMEN
jgi:hypothetical protein